MLKQNGFLRTAAALTLVAGLAAIPQAVAAQDAQSAFDATQTEALEALVKQYILDHPEVVVEALHRYEQQQLTANPADPVMGNPLGDVTLVEFFDYRCPYCKHMTGALAQLIDEDPKLRVVMKEFPILSNESVEASRAAMAALRQGKYHDFHFALMENGGGLSAEEILAVADSVGLDSQRLQSDMKDPAIDAVLRNNQALAERLGISGTPAFIVGGRVLPGAVKIDDLRAMIAEARAKGG